MATSLIVEGGGMRGLYTAGVLDGFIQENLYWNNVYCVSAGSCHALSYMSRQFDRARRVNVNYVKKARYSGLWCMLRHGTFFGFDFIFNTIPSMDRIDWTTFFRSQNENRKFKITVTNVRTGLAEYITPGTPEEAIRWLEASSSLPVLGRPVDINGEKWFDGGIADSIPVKKACEDGHEKHVIILTREKGYRKDSFSQAEEKLIKRLYRKYPAFVETNMTRTSRYNETLDFIDSLEKEGKAFVFRPPAEKNVGRLCKNKNKLEALYQAGYRECLSRLNDLKAFSQGTSGFDGGLPAED